MFLIRDFEARISLHLFNILKMENDGGGITVKCYFMSGMFLAPSTEHRSVR
jgi:hypothetical protein